MIRHLSIAAAPVLAAAALALSPSAADAAHHGRVQGLLVRPAGTHSAKLSWDAVKGARRYRVLRRGHVMRTTTRRSLKVRLTKAKVRYRVAAVGGRPSKQVIVVAGHSPPRVSVAAAASSVTNHTAILSWGKSRAVHARIAGYRVIPSKGKPRMVKRTRIGVKGLRSASTMIYRVMAVDTMGWGSRRTGPIRVVTGHLPPRQPGIPTPLSVGDTTLSLGWQPSKPRARTQLRGYRLMRDGVVVRQIPTTRIDLTNLAPKSVHNWTVAAIDTQGMMSKPSPAARVVQADPPPTEGTAHVYELASTDASFQAFQQHYRQIGYVYPTFFDCNRSTAAIEGRNDPLIVRYAQDRKVKVLPRFNCQSATILHKILTDPATRTAWLNGMTALVAQNGYDGLNVDFEQIPASDRAALTSFIQQLAARLHAQGKLLSQAVSAKVKDIPDHPRSGAFDYKALSNYDDFLFVMAWGIHWSTSAPGPQDDLSWVTQVVNYVATMPNPQKWVIGTMLYGFDWPDGGGPDHPGTALHFADVQALIARYHVTPVYDQTMDSWHFSYTDPTGVSHVVWYNDAPVTARRVALALRHGFKVGFWRIGQEDQRIWQNPQLPGGQ